MREEILNNTCNNDTRVDSINPIRGAASAAPVIVPESATSVVPGLVVCPLCSRSFKGKNGLAIH